MRGWCACYGVRWRGQGRLVGAQPHFVKTVACRGVAWREGRRGQGRRRREGSYRSLSDISVIGSVLGSLSAGEPVGM